MTKSKTEGATWAPVTLAMPQLIEWQIEGDAARQAGSSLCDFVAALAKADVTEVTIGCVLIPEYRDRWCP